MVSNVEQAVRGYGAVTDAGPARPLNEDAYLAVPARQLFGVADGFGGAGIGDAAAKKCLENVKYFVEHGLGDSEVTLPFIYRTYYTAGANLIFNAFLYANQQLFIENKTKSLNSRGGASVMFAFFEGRHMTLANAGLCGAFLLRRGRAQPLIKPRSYNALKGGFQGSWNPKWAFPLMAMGQAMDLEPEIIELKVERGDVILMATDGVYPRLTEEDFSECYSMLKKKDTLDVAIQQQNQRIVELTQHKGNTDNLALITLVCG
jgi:serine/threonine protein phosphatase PrpC